MPGDKHLIQCHCVLPQFRKREDPIFHKFVVFSQTDGDGNVIPKISKCNNCGVLHKITDFCKSEIMHGIDESFAVIDIKDISDQIPEKIRQIPESHKCDISTWEQVDNVIQNKEWKKPIVIARKSILGSTQVKILSIDEKLRYKIESHLRNDEINKG